MEAEGRLVTLHELHFTNSFALHLVRSSPRKNDNKLTKGRVLSQLAGGQLIFIFM